MANEPRFSVEIKDLHTGEAIFFTSCDWTEHEKQAAIITIHDLCRPRDETALAASGFQKPGH